VWCFRDEIGKKERSLNTSSAFRRTQCLLLSSANRVKGASKNYWGNGSGWGVFIKAQRAAGIFTARISSARELYKFSAYFDLGISFNAFEENYQSLTHIIPLTAWRIGCC